MSRSWKIQAVAACTLIVLMFAAVGGRYVALRLEYMPKAAEEESAPAPAAAKWGTVVQSCMTHEGPGLRYAMNGQISEGHAVEVVRELDGWYKCLTWTSQEPVWIDDEYLEFAE